MTANQPNEKQATVMLAADVSSYSVTTVTLAVEMAASVQTGLLGLFVEDEDLLRVAGLPCTREITLTTTRERPTSTHQMQRSLQAAALQFKKSLQKEAQASQIAWHFDTVRGRMRDIGLKPHLDVSYTIVSRPVSHQLQSGQVRKTRRILLILDDSPRQQHALDVVLRRFQREKVELTVVGEDPDIDLSSILTAGTEDKHGAITIKSIPRDNLFELLSRAGPNFDCAIMSQHEKAEELARVLNALRCPAILVT